MKTKYKIDSNNLIINIYNQFNNLDNNINNIYNITNYILNYKINFKGKKIKIYYNNIYVGCFDLIKYYLNNLYINKKINNINQYNSYFTKIDITEIFI